jgi:hypothetical protein
MQFRSACCRRIMLSLFGDLDFRADAHWTHAGLSLLLPEKEIHSEGFPFTTASEVKVRSLNLRLPAQPAAASICQIT